MTDATEHMDWPGAGPFTVQVRIGGLPVPYYTHPDQGRTLLIKSNAVGVRDTLVREFADRFAAQEWIEREYRTGRRP